jgi:Mn-containing catalase
MFYHDKNLQYTVKVEKPNPLFAKALQQALGGIEGEIRVAMQYFFQAWGSRGPTKYRDMLMETATEELAHIEMLATAIALNLENAPASMQESGATSPIVEAVMGGGNAGLSIETIMSGMIPRHLLSTGGAAMPCDSNGVSFDMSHIYASGNIAGDMYCNVAAEATGRVLACRLYHLTDDPGMKDMLSFMIARDTMHQQQWLAVIEELGGMKGQLPIPNSFNQDLENKEFSYTFLGTMKDGTPPEPGRWTTGPSLDGKGTFRAEVARPMGGEPKLGPARPDLAAQKEQMTDTPPM